MASKLIQMQARFQQKQMQDKEEKLLKMYENQQQKAFEKVGRSSAGSNSSTTSIGSTGKGKVRQMFEERRQKAGVDKSYPLEPLKANGSSRKVQSTTSVKSVTSKTTAQIRNGKSVFQQKEASQRMYNNNYTNGNYEEHSSVVETFDNNNMDSHSKLVDSMNNHNINDDDFDIDQLPKIGFNDGYKEKPAFMTGKLSNLGGKLPSQRFIEENPPKTNIVTERSRNPPYKVPAKKPTAKAAHPPPRSNSSVSSTATESPRSSPTRQTEKMQSKPQVPSAKAPTNNRPSSKQVAKSPVVRDDLAECRFCGRRFATDRLGVHEDICGKTGKKKRKAYDATKHRVQGTELESYVAKPGKKGASSKASTKQPSSKAGNWRKTHEEFISTIRAAKQAQAYVAQGGKLSDLPPPPPSTNPDYVQCPHCGRRFNEAAAERHIPKCASYSFNKPKNAAPSKARPAGKR